MVCTEIRDFPCNDEGDFNMTKNTCVITKFDSEFSSCIWGQKIYRKDSDASRDVYGSVYNSLISSDDTR